jgi:hypothetical protein
MHRPRLFHTVRETCPRRLQTDAAHRNIKFLAILSFVDRLLSRADHLDTKALQDTFSGES